MTIFFSLLSLDHLHGHEKHVLCSKIKIEIDINNDELLKTIFEHMKGKEKGKGGGGEGGPHFIKLIILHLL
jgi:hypothetical protein